MDSGHERRKYEPKVVYYLGFGDRVKIGSTADLPTRLGHIPHDEVLAVEPGDVALERQRHNEFAKLHIRGEWYEAQPVLLEHAARIRQQYPDLMP